MKDMEENINTGESLRKESFPDEERFSRTERLIGKESAGKLYLSCVAVFGLGGVGSYVTEALARAGVGHLILVDSDTVSPSNINRQLIAVTDTVGRDKTEVEKERILSINPACRVDTYKIFYDEDTADAVDLTDADYVCDAIDYVKGKLLLIEYCKKRNIPVISAMGTGNKLCPGAFEISDISKTSVCPLARKMRQELKKRGIFSLKVLYSREIPKKNENGEVFTPPASISFVPGAAGLMIAGEIISDIACLRTPG